MIRLSTYSIDINVFTQSKHDYEPTLKNCGYKINLKQPLCVIMERIYQGKFYGLRRQIIWL